MKQIFIVLILTILVFSNIQAQTNTKNSLETIVVNPDKYGINLYHLKYTLLKDNFTIPQKNIDSDGKFEVLINKKKKQ